MDWFVANYSKKNNTFYKIKVNGKEDFFYVNNEYKNQLNGYSKLYFDPFCRKKKVEYRYRDKDGKNAIGFTSSIGQLNFFQWAIRNKVIVYVKSHIKDIEQDMKDTSKKNKEKKAASLNDVDTKHIEMDQEDDQYDGPDPVICSSDKINSVRISPVKKAIQRSESDKKNKRQQLSKSVYEVGIKKSNIPIKLDFD